MRRFPIHFTLLAALLSTLAVSAAEPDTRKNISAWPSFRGSSATGAVTDADPPLSWSESKNVAWKVELEGSGHASPVVWGDRIFVMSAIETSTEAPSPATDEPEAPQESRRGGGREPRDAPTKVHRFVVAAHDLESGQRLWSTVVREAVPHESLHSTASQASASPVTDGKHVWAFFGSRGLYCLTTDGELVWEVDLGTAQTRNAFGEGASPVVAGDSVIVNWDHEGDSFIVALNKKTGKEVWRNERDEPTSWSTPLLLRDGKRELVVVSAANAVRAYEVRSGKEIWRVSGLGLNVVPTPVADDTTVWVMSGWREAHGMAVRYPGAKGDLTGTDRVVWETDRGLSYVPSAVLLDGRIYFFQRFTGILSCFTLTTGKPCYDQQRIENHENVYASPVAAGDRIYSVTRDGGAVVFSTGDEFEVLGRSELDDVFNATPAIVGDSLILRGDRFLYRIAEARPKK